MARPKVKPEMKGTGGGRWGKRVDVKKASKKVRRLQDKELIDISSGWEWLFSRYQEARDAEEELEGDISPYQE